MSKMYIASIILFFDVMSTATACSGSRSEHLRGWPKDLFLVFWPCQDIFSGCCSSSACCLQSTIIFCERTFTVTLHYRGHVGYTTPNSESVLFVVDYKLQIATSRISDTWSKSMYVAKTFFGARINVHQQIQCSKRKKNLINHFL